VLLTRHRVFSSDELVTHKPFQTIAWHTNVFYCAGKKNSQKTPLQRFLAYRKGKSSLPVSRTLSYGKEKKDTGLL
jgi:hypothetical protein